MQRLDSSHSESHFGGHVNFPSQEFPRIFFIEVMVLWAPLLSLWGLQGPLQGPQGERPAGATSAEAAPADLPSRAGWAGGLAGWLGLGPFPTSAY